jgi:hypothetical protein
MVALDANHVAKPALPQSCASSIWSSAISHFF